jgi:hypothetical protein
LNIIGPAKNGKKISLKWEVKEIINICGSISVSPVQNRQNLPLLMTDNFQMDYIHLG